MLNFWLFIDCSQCTLPSLLFVMVRSYKIECPYDESKLMNLKSASFALHNFSAATILLCEFGVVSLAK